MKKTRITTALIVALALTVLAGEAFAGRGGGRGRGGRQGWDNARGQGGRQGWESGRGRGGGPGFGRGMAGRPGMGANFQAPQQDNSWAPGPFCPYAQGPYQNIPGFQGRGRGGFGIGQGFLGRGMGPCGQGFGRRDMMMQRRPMAGRGGRGFQDRGPAIQGRGGRGFQRRNIAPQGWGMNNRPGRPGPGAIGRQGPGMQPGWFAPADTDQANRTMPPRGRGRNINRGQGWTPYWGPNPKPQKAPETIAPAAPVLEDNKDKPQAE